MSETHPHIEGPTAKQLRSVVEERPDAVRELYLAAHELVVDTLPDVRFSVDLADGEIGYGAHQYGYDGWGMAALAPYTRWVSIAFLRATSLSDPAGLLEGSGVSIRHVKVRSVEQLREVADALRALVKAAACLHRQAESAG